MPNPSSAAPPKTPRGRGYPTGAFPDARAAVPNSDAGREDRTGAGLPSDASPRGVVKAPGSDYSEMHREAVRYGSQGPLHSSEDGTTVGVQPAAHNQGGGADAPLLPDHSTTSEGYPDANNRLGSQTNAQRRPGAPPGLERKGNVSVLGAGQQVPGEPGAPARDLPGRNRNRLPCPRRYANGDGPDRSLAVQPDGPSGDGLGTRHLKDSLPVPQDGGDGEGGGKYAPVGPTSGMRAAPDLLAARVPGENRVQQ